MFDAFRSYIEQDNSKYFDGSFNQKGFEKFGLQFNPSFNSKGEVAKFSATYNKIRVIILKGKIIFSGSFHTAFKGHNACEFNFSDFRFVMRLLKMKFGEVFTKSKISNLEYGVLLDNDEVNWIKYKNVFADKMKDKHTGKIYGQKIVLHDFEIKKYDKLLQMALKDNVFKTIPIEGFRIEVRIKRMRSIQTAKKPINIYRIEDLLDRRNLRDLHEHLLTLITKITKESNSVDNLLVENEELMNIYALMNLEKTNKLLKIKDKNTHKSYSRKLRKMLNDTMMDYDSNLKIKLDRHLKLVLS